VRILGISGSLREGSLNTQLLRAAADVVPFGVELELFDELELVPPYNEDRDTDTPPDAAARLRERIAAADALLIATPEYNGSIPGQLKNAVDWGSRPFRASALWAKPAAVMGASTSAYGAMWAQADLRKSLGIAGARVLDRELSVAKAHECFQDGALVDEEIADQLALLLDGLLESAAPVSSAPPDHAAAAIALSRVAPAAIVSASSGQMRSSGGGRRRNGAIASRSSAASGV